jgi:ethanolamine ammonia-lyase small subunit
MTSDNRDYRGDALSGEAFSDHMGEIVRRIRARTPAWILLGRAGAAYRTQTQMDLRAAHAAARDAVRAEIDAKSALGAAFVEEWSLFEACTQARSKDEFLLRPDLGRRFNLAARQALPEHCTHDVDFQVVIGDGLSVPAVAAQVPGLLPLLVDAAKARGWQVGRPFIIRHCRVGILNEIGELLNPRVVVLLIGERPGLATTESLSAYMAYRPRAAHTDADRNLISNIHARGAGWEDATARIIDLAAQMMAAERSGCEVRERWSSGALREPE